MERDRTTLSNYVNQIRSRDADLNTEIDAALAKKAKPTWLHATKLGLESLNWTPAPTSALAPGFGDLEEESIVLRMGRPVINILHGKAQLQFGDTGSDTWRKRLEQSTTTIAPAVNAIGRIEVKNHPSGFDYMGTGWVIDEGVIVTNRHVALSFAARGGEGFTFLTGFDRKNPIAVDIDFLEEFGNPVQQPLNISRVLYIAKDNEPDVAFLQLEPATASLNPRPIRLGSSLIPQNVMVAIIGYPARDNRIPDAALMDRIFGEVYNKKRLAPGFSTGFARQSIQHDCSTLGGNSGSPLIDLATGEVCGLHYSGIFLEANYAVPSPVLKKLLNDVRGGRPLLPMPNPSTEVPVNDHPPITLGDSRQELRFTIPLEVTLKLGALQVGHTMLTTNLTDDAAKPAAIATMVQTNDVEVAVVEAKRLFGQRQDIYAIEAGWKFSDGWITKQRAVVIAVKSRLTPAQLQAQGILSLPTEVLGIPTDIRVARLEEISPIPVAEARGTGWHSTYQRLPDEATLLALVEDRMTLTLHASPDAGWAVLSEFLSKTQKSLTVGMYDFTAPHIIEAVIAATKPRGRSFKLVLDRGESIGTGVKQNDKPEEDTINTLHSDLKARFGFAWAAVGGASSPIKSAYHIKVAVRDGALDGAAFWLSSGNWQSSNQPEENPLPPDTTTPPLLNNCNREWHVVVEHAGLARSFEKYLLHDLEQATEAVQEGVTLEQPMVWVPAGYFQPSALELEGLPRYTPAKTIKNKKVRVQPLLTPDNYGEHVLKLIESAKERLYFQNQSLSILETNPEHYERLLQALLAKQQAGLDLRLIIRNIGDLRTTVSRILDYGFDTNQLRLQTNCHNKGIVVDSKVVLLGSQNWTGDGTGPNRDASLIFFDDEIAQYYETIFLYDWERIGKPKIDESLPAPEPVTLGDFTPRPGMVLIPISRWLGEG